MAASDMVIEIPGIKGESQKDAHEGWIDVYSWNFGASNLGSQHIGGGGGAGKADFQDFQMAIGVNSATPAILKFCAVGEHITAPIKFESWKGGGKPVKFLEITFTNSLLASYTTSGADGEQEPMAHVSINFAQVKLEYFKQDKDGNAASAGVFEFDIEKGVVMA